MGRVKVASGERGWGRGEGVLPPVVVVVVVVVVAKRGGWVGWYVVGV
jgi:hypothetical protein